MLNFGILVLARQSNTKHSIVFFIRRHLNDIELIPHSKMKKSTGSFVIVVENESIVNIRAKLFEKNSFVTGIVDLTIALHRGNGTYSFFGRDVETESKLVLLNIWRRGEFMWPKRSIFPKGRLQNLRGKKLRATSFEYEPFIYKENNTYNGYEVINIHVF